MRLSKKTVVVLIAYLALAVLFTWPLATKLTTNGFGYDEDAPYHIWHNWWFKYSIFDLHQSPLVTDYIFHPQKVNLIYDANAFVFSALTLPIQFLTGNVILASNLVFLLSFILSGFGAYLLGKQIIGREGPSFIAGFIFAFNPYTLAQGLDGHINLTTTWIIPLYTYFLIRSLANDSNPASPKFQISNFKFQIVAGIVAALQLYNDFTYSAFLIIETGLILLFLTSKNLTAKNFTLMYQYIKTILIIGVVACVLSSPILFEVAKAAKEGFGAGSPLWVQNVWSADLLTFFRPNDHSTFLKNPWTPNIGTVEGTAFVGYTVIFLLAAYLLGRIFWRKRNPNPSPSLTVEGLIIFLSVSFFLLMLGPSLHYANNFQFSIFPVKGLSALGGNFQIIFPLPYILLHKIPFVGETQEPGRLFPFFILPLSILAGLGLTQILDKLKNAYLKSALFLAIIFLVAAEYLPLPFPTTDLTSKPVFDAIRSDPSNKAVLTLPLGFNSGNYVLGDSPIGSLQFYQSYFQKPSFRATVARVPYSYFEYYQNLPLIPYLINPVGEPPKIDYDKSVVRNILQNSLGIKYILVFENKYTKPLGQTLNLLKEVAGAKEFYNRDGLIGFKL
ncbi:MAG: hypothetical protein M1352_02920 [Patescibacteria group bacterium]|nr:hypothetical protein [Patescibacteria group bacterium]